MAWKSRQLTVIYRHGECPAAKPNFCVNLKGSLRKVESLIGSLFFWSIFALEWGKNWFHFSVLMQQNKFIKMFTFFPEGFCSDCTYYKSVVTRA